VGLISNGRKKYSCKSDADKKAILRERGNGKGSSLVEGGVCHATGGREGGFRR